MHHLTHKADGGKTSVKDCGLFCFFHHQVVIHQWGWTVVLNPDGTTSAWNRDKTKVLHSHGPQARPGVTPPGLVPVARESAGRATAPGRRRHRDCAR